MDYVTYLALLAVFYLVSFPGVFSRITNDCLENVISQTRPLGQQHSENDVLFKSLNPNHHVVGRHVCRYERIVMKPYEEVQSYCKPTYLTYLRKCDGNDQGFCTEYRVVYELAHRSIQKMVAETEVFSACCPGWSKTRASSKGCRKAICVRECQNGGSCIKPNRCACLTGWTGRFCQTDIDECQRSPSHCDQICINWPGSYKCSCHDGFSMSSDGKTCKKIGAEESEGSELIHQYVKLSTKITEIEKQLKMMDDLSHRVQILSENIQSLKNRTEEEDRAVTGSEENPLARIHSLSEQMAIIEERLAECSCNSPTRSRLQPPAG